MAKDLQRSGGDEYAFARSVPETRLGHREKALLDSLLNESVQEGYLDLDEYEKRVERVLDARTLGEAERLLADLPPYQRILAGGASGGEDGTPAWIKWVWFGLGIPAATTFGIWTVILLVSGSTQAYWFLYPLVPLLVVGGALTLAERSIIRPWWREEKRKQRLRRAQKNRR
ncbi:DUF1707 SHOCT-like domain-containing protein [Salininema proteolyticum]|uniref:DUF1707 domain-containing protein n=1 Tax=Salininema proteolyticum TaxID=1607685 RepID=A0ABV8TZ16_9ACTN